MRRLCNVFCLHVFEPRRPSTRRRVATCRWYYQVPSLLIESFGRAWVPQGVTMIKHRCRMRLTENTVDSEYACVRRYNLKGCYSHGRQDFLTWWKWYGNWPEFRIGLQWKHETNSCPWKRYPETIAEGLCLGLRRILASFTWIHQQRSPGPGVWKTKETTIEDRNSLKSDVWAQEEERSPRVSPTWQQ